MALFWGAIFIWGAKGIFRRKITVGDISEERTKELTGFKGFLKKAEVKNAYVLSPDTKQYKGIKAVLGSVFLCLVAMLAFYLILSEVLKMLG